MSVLDVHVVVELAQGPSTVQVLHPHGRQVRVETLGQQQPFPSRPGPLRSSPVRVQAAAAAAAHAAPPTAQRGGGAHQAAGGGRFPQSSAGGEGRGRRWRCRGCAVSAVRGLGGALAAAEAKALLLEVSELGAHLQAPAVQLDQVVVLLAVQSLHLMQI